MRASDAIQEVLKHKESFSESRKLAEKYKKLVLLPTTNTGFKLLFRL